MQIAVDWLHKEVCKSSNISHLPIWGFDIDEHFLSTNIDFQIPIDTFCKCEKYRYLGQLVENSAIYNLDHSSRKK